MIKFILYLFLIMFFYRALSRLIALPNKEKNNNENKNKRGVKYQDAEFKEID